MPTAVFSMKKIAVQRPVDNFDELHSVPPDLSTIVPGVCLLPAQPEPSPARRRAGYASALHLRCVLIKRPNGGHNLHQLSKVDSSLSWAA
jgi:hypothetical protein